MKTKEHIWISILIFTSIGGLLGGIAADIFHFPVTLYDWNRKRKGLPFKELNNWWVKINWFCHSIWFLFLLFVMCIPNGYIIFWKAYLLHLILDVCTHSDKRALKIFYPFSMQTIDLWKNGYIKRKD